MEEMGRQSGDLGTKETKLYCEYDVQVSLYFVIL